MNREISERLLLEGKLMADLKRGSIALASPLKVEESVDNINLMKRYKNADTHSKTNKTMRCTGAFEEIECSQLGTKTKKCKASASVHTFVIEFHVGERVLIYSVKTHLVTFRLSSIAIIYDIA